MKIYQKNVQKFYPKHKNIKFGLQAYYKFSKALLWTKHKVLFIFHRDAIGFNTMGKGVKNGGP